MDISMHYIVSDRYAADSVIGMMNIRAKAHIIERDEDCEALFDPPRSIGTMRATRFNVIEIEEGFGTSVADVMERMCSDMALVAEHLDEDAPGYFYIDRVDIDEQHRGEGHGLTMVARAILEFSQCGDQVFLIPFHEKLIAYWEQLGFELLCADSKVMMLDTQYAEPMQLLEAAARIQAMDCV